MPGGVTNYYEVLDVPPTASPDEIKKRYRQLARRFHPDVNPDDPDAARKFTEVADAYRVLSDANSRGAHDFDLARVRQIAEAAERRRAAAESRSAGAAGAAATPRPAATAASAATAGSESARLVAQAKAAFERSRLVEARSLAEQSLRLNRRNAQAYEILGDIFRLQNRVDEAMNMYSMALQINPRSPQVMERLERMSRASSARAAAGGFGSHPGARTSPPPPRRDGAYRPSAPPSAPPGTGGAAFGQGDAPESGTGYYVPPSAPTSLYGDRRHEESARRAVLARMLYGVIGYGLTLLLALGLSFHGTPPPPEIGAPSWPLLQQISSWTPAVWGVLIGCGFLLGATMTCTLAIRRIEDELMLPAAGRGGRFLPVGAVLIVLSIVNFYAAALLYLVIQYFQEAITPSILRVFGAVVLIVVLIGIAYSPGFGQILLFGGNVVFLSLLVGWVLGDFFRPYGH